MSFKYIGIKINYKNVTFCQSIVYSNDKIFLITGNSSGMKFNEMIALTVTLCTVTAKSR